MTTDKYHNTTSNYNHVKTDTWHEAIIFPMVKETDILIFILLETSAVSLDTIY